MENIDQICFPVLTSKNEYLGCAFRWDARFYVTCKHILDDVEVPNIAFNVTSKKQRIKKALNVFRSQKYDLSLIEVEAQEDTDGQLLKHYSDNLKLGDDLLLPGYTQSAQVRTIEPRLIKTYVNMCHADADEWLVNKYGLIALNQIYVQIPKGFSGGPVLHPRGDLLIGMSMGTNTIEINPVIALNKSTTRSDDEERPETYYYGIFHTVNNIKSIIATMPEYSDSPT